MVFRKFPEGIEIDFSIKSILFGGDRLRGVIAYSVVKEGEKIVSVASLSVNGDYNMPEIVGVYVVEGHRKKGYAGELILKLKTYFDEQIGSKIGTKSKYYANINTVFKYS